MAAVADGGGPGASGGRFWVPHEASVWLPCRLDSISGAVATLRAETSRGEVVTYDAVGLGALAQVEDQQLEGVDDICSLHTVHEAALLHSARIRYSRQQIYTRVSRILIALNPFAALPIYSADCLRLYASARDSLDLPPHIFGTGHDALRGLREGFRDQAIVISGESGAGKTESAKLLLSYVAEVVKAEAGGHVEADGAGPGMHGVEEKVMRTNPVLEAFGNAMTVRNNNSSRFGKWLDMRFAATMGMLGCRVTSYLLEVTRVCSQVQGERGFHIFCQLLHERQSPALQGLELQEMGQYVYLRNSALHAPGIDDKLCFEELCSSLSALGFSEEEKAQIFKIVAGILTLGNCVFDAGDDRAMLRDAAPLLRTGELFGVDPRMLGRCMLWRKVVAGTDVTETPLKVDQAEAVRNGLGRMLYRHLFEWLIRRINLQLGTGDQADLSPVDGEVGAVESRDAAATDRDRLLGILDISGFESFEVNSLEQLLINLSNEHLQMQFNDHVFRSELEDCAKEGVTLGQDIVFADNADVVALLDGRAGVLDILDEEIAMPKASDLTFVTKVLRGHSKHSRMVVSRFSSGRACFGVNHFAGDVTYDCEGFLEKNADRFPSDDALSLLNSSEMQVLRDVVQVLLNERQAAGGGGDVGSSPGQPGAPRSKKPKSATSRFRSSLRELMAKVCAADNHYVRCIKPNKAKIPNEFTADMVREQMLFSGVLEAVRIRQQGYSSRMPFPSFVLRYRCVAAVRTVGASRAGLISWALTNGHASDQSRAQELVAHFLACGSFSSLSGRDFVVGNTKLFMKTGAVSQLEAARAVAYQAAILRLQSAMRGALARRAFAQAWPKLREVRSWLLSYCPPRFWHVDRLDELIFERFQSLEVAEREASMFGIWLKQQSGLLHPYGIVHRALSAQQRLQEEVARLIAEEEERKRREAEEAERRRLEEETRAEAARQAAVAAAAAEEARLAQEAAEVEEARRLEELRRQAQQEESEEAAGTFFAQDADDLDLVTPIVAVDTTGWSYVNLRREILRLTEEKEELRKALQNSLLDSLQREEDLQEECTKLRMSGGGGGSSKLGDLSPRSFRSKLAVALEEEAKASRAARIHFIDENAELKSLLAMEQEKSRMMRTELQAFRLLRARGSWGPAAGDGDGDPMAGVEAVSSLSSSRSCSSSRSSRRRPHSAEVDVPEFSGGGAVSSTDDGRRCHVGDAGEPRDFRSSRGGGGATPGSGETPGDAAAAGDAAAVGAAGGASPTQRVPRLELNGHIAGGSSSASSIRRSARRSARNNELHGGSSPQCSARGCVADDPAGGRRTSVGRDLGFASRDFVVGDSRERSDSPVLRAVNEKALAIRAARERNAAAWAAEMAAAVAEDVSGSLGGGTATRGPSQAVDELLPLFPPSSTQPAIPFSAPLLPAAALVPPSAAAWVAPAPSMAAVGSVPARTEPGGAPPSALSLGGALFEV